MSTPIKNIELIRGERERRNTYQSFDWLLDNPVLFFFKFSFLQSIESIHPILILHSSSARRAIKTRRTWSALNFVRLKNVESKIIGEWDFSYTCTRTSIFGRSLWSNTIFRRILDLFELCYSEYLRMVSRFSSKCSNWKSKRFRRE